MAEHNVTLSGAAPAPTTRRFRRLVTGLDESGKAVFVSDGESPSVQVVANTPTFVVTNFWQHAEVPVDNNAPLDDGVSGPVSLNPPAGGSVFRIVEFPPDSDWSDRPDGPSDQVHATPSLDYALVIEGDVWAVLDGEEREMHPGDVLIQRGTRHAWSNRTQKAALVAFTLIGGTAVQD
ncbi:cupin domain-containing protein [Microbacterium sp.]|uniref:cupin domain-containing protein n=1 Tax=Microbacterium sp. TaxID=51671 RepID=UPI003F945207